MISIYVTRQILHTSIIHICYRTSTRIFQRSLSWQKFIIYPHCLISISMQRFCSNKIFPESLLIRYHSNRSVKHCKKVFCHFIRLFVIQMPAQTFISEYKNLIFYSSLTIINSKINFIFHFSCPIQCFISISGIICTCRITIPYLIRTKKFFIFVQPVINLYFLFFHKIL